MDRRSFIKGTAISLCSFHALKLHNVFAADISNTPFNGRLRINLSGAGRIGFYIDYSELSQTGTHTFFVCRTHGTEGAVSVKYSTGGDSHQQSTGTLSWADGEADIKSFTATVPTKTETGDHRIWAQLSDPSGGALLHFGEKHTTAHGIIDDASIASNSAAVFYDAQASSGGNGTLQSPYNNILTAIANVGNKRYLYGRGITTVNTEYTTKLEGTSGLYMLPAPAGRSDENNRIYVRNWPGHNWTVKGSGNSTSRGGFYAKSGESYHTYRGINFADLDASSIANGFGVFYQYGNSEGINVELCSAENINGRSGYNNGAYMLWGVNGGKVWRCAAKNIQTAGSNSNQNTAGIFSYDGENLSIQRCDVSDASSLMYHKRVSPGSTSSSVRFCIDKTNYGVHYGASGSSGASHSYTIVQGNFFSANGKPGIYHWPGGDGSNGLNSGEKHWWANNVFYGRGGGEEAAITFRQGYKAAIFNNIMLNCRKVWAEFTNTTQYGAVIEFANFNLDQGTTLTSQRYEWKGVNYSSASALFSEGGYAGNDNTGDPLFTSTYLPRVGSPARSGGVGGSAQGIYLIGIEQLGPNLEPLNPDSTGLAPPAKTTISASVAAS